MNLEKVSLTMKNPSYLYKMTHERYVKEIDGANISQVGEG